MTAPDLIIRDALDSTDTEVCNAKACGIPVITLEDLGPGAAYADLVVNELFRKRPEDGANVVSGPKWSVLRPEFTSLPEYQVREKPERVLIVVGGTDASDLTDRFVRSVPSVVHMRGLDPTPVHRRVVVGPGTDDSRHWWDHEPGISVTRCPESMAAEMMAADLILCSAGRTVHEAAAVGVPVISVPVNAREQEHSHCAGVLRMPLHARLGDEDLRGTVTRVLENPSLRADMSRTARAAIDGKGVRRLAARVEQLLEGL